VNEYVRQYPPKSTTPPPATPPPGDVEALREKLSGSFAKQYKLPTTEQATDVIAGRNAQYKAEKDAKALVDAVESGNADFSDLDTPDATDTLAALQRRLKF